MSQLANIIAANIFISLISLIGAFLLLSKKFLVKKVTHIFVSFAAGVLLASAFLNLLHEALENSEPQSILLTVLIGMVFSFFMERFFLWYHHHHEDTHNIHPSAILVIIGDGIHNFIDGFAIAATFIINPALGLTTTFAVAAHEIPQEIADLSILTHAGLDKKRALLLNFLSALTAILGGIVGFYFIQSFSDSLPFALAFTAGIFIYVASSDLIPDLHEDIGTQNIPHQVLPFIIGTLLIFALSFTRGH